ncbi:MAG: BBE domain-containing protein [Verrucomicrobia bacterium]|nr:BBE domain-containing protein [Verrucomicrobiota bacterium]
MKKRKNQNRIIAKPGSFYSGDDNPDSSYRTNIDRLAEIKEKYDPNNVLRSTVNIKYAE